MGLGNQVIARRAGFTWALDLDEGIDLSLYLLRRFERRTLGACLRLLTPGDVALDIGANIGAYTLHLARAVGHQGRVIALEPTTFALSKLRLNLSLNPEVAKRVSVRQVMLVDRAGAAVPGSLYSSWPLVQEVDINRKHGGRLMDTNGASAMTLDAFLEEEGIEAVSLIKLDVDGHECTVLRGGRKTLARCRPSIVMELAPYALEEAGDSVERLIDILNGVGYRMIGLFDRMPLPNDRQAIHSIVPDGCSINVLAGPR